MISLQRFVKRSPAVNYIFKMTRMSTRMPLSKFSKTSTHRSTKFYLCLVCAVILCVFYWYSPIAGLETVYSYFISGTAISAPQRGTNVSEKILGKRCMKNGKCVKREGNAIFNEVVLYKAVQNIHNSLRGGKKAEQCLERLPQCIIIGVMKCGTRELIDFMAIHPNIVIKHKPIYEINYFLKEEQSLDWYRRQMPCSYSDQITVTKSPFYFSLKDVPERLFRYNKTLKMILLVREPIERILSEISFRFFQRTSKLLEQNLMEMPEVDDLLVDNVTGCVKERNFGVRLSSYDVAMERYLKYFSRGQILIIDSGEFRKNPAKVLSKVETFLGLEHFISEDMFVYNSEKHHYCLRRKRDGMACYGTNRGRIKQKPLKPSTLKILKKYFNEHNEAFFKLIKQRFDW